MIGWDSICLSFWWVFPLLMVIFCIFMMRGKKFPMMCGFGFGETNGQSVSGSESAMEILDKRYALGEINSEEYQEKKKTLSQRSDKI